MQAQQGWVLPFAMDIVFMAFTYMVNFSICPFSCVIWYITFIPSISKHTILFTINYCNCLFVKSLTRTFWFVWFFLIFQLYLHKLPYLEMCTDHVYSFVPPFPDFLAIFILATSFGNVHRPHQQYLYMSMIVYIISIFFLALSRFFNYICTNYHIWKCAQTTSIIPQHCQ